MALIEEIPPIMVLAEESADRLVFRFRSRRWGVATLAGGLALIAISGWFHFSHHFPFLQLAIFYFAGLLLLYSSLYSFTADQFLIVDGKDGSLHFHKQDLYGRVDWERPGNQFKEIRVFRPGRTQGSGQTKNWAIMLACCDGLELFLGENEFGSLSREGALALAANVGRLTGITITADSP